MPFSTCHAFVAGVPLARARSPCLTCSPPHRRYGLVRTGARAIASQPVPTPTPAPTTYGAGAEGRALRCEEGAPLLHVVFVHPQIHWNTGNMGRTCLGLGARLHLVGPLGFSLDAAQIRRAGLDYWEHVDLRVYDDWDDFCATAHMDKAHAFFYTKFGDNSAADVAWPADGRPVYLVFGSEVNGFDGIRQWLEQNTDSANTNTTTVAFPMVDTRFRSFNLSTTASMALWDAYKSINSAMPVRT